MACAIPRWFDASTLRGLLDDPRGVSATLATVITWPWVTPVPGQPTRYHLDPAIRQTLLTRLQDEQLPRYKTLQRRAFDHFIERRPTASIDDQEAFEDDLAHHLDQLFFLYMNANELTELATVLGRASQAAWGRLQHRHTLTYYDACLRTVEGRYDSAAALYQRLLSQPELESALRPRVLTALGLNFYHRGQFDQAIQAHEQSRQAYAALGDRLGQGKALKNLGIVYHDLGEYEHARSLYQQCYRLFQAVGDLTQQAWTLNELGFTSKELGQWDAALRYYEQSLAIWRQLESQESQSRVYNNLGEVYHLTGQWTKAQAYYEKALTIALDPRYLNQREAADMLSNLGFLACTQDRWQEARDYYARALQLAQQVDHPAAISQIYYRLGQLYERQQRPYLAYRAYRQAIEAIEAMRGQIERQEVKISLLRTRQQPYEAMVLLCWRLGWWAKVFQYMEQARARAFLDLLARHNASHGEPTAVALDKPLTLRQVQRRLAPGAVLIEYFTTGVVEWNNNLRRFLPPASQTLLSHLTSPAYTLALVVTRHSLTCHQLALSPNVLRISPADPATGRRWLDDKKMQRLYTDLLGPFQARLEAASLVIVVPHGPLHRVPFQALRRPDGRSLIRPGGPLLTYAPSATVFLRYCTPPRIPAPDPCLALGYNGPRPIQLRHAEEEAQTVAALWGGDAWVGPEAKKGRFFDTHSRYRVIHFSCHGQFEAHDPLASALRVADTEVLTASEILAGLRLSADLVVLSACESGVSHITRGDELLGLVRAFILAGASSLLVTLWKVEEMSTRMAMERFHQAVVVGQSKAQALQNAQLYLQRLTLDDIRASLARYGYSQSEINAWLDRLSSPSPPSQESIRSASYPFADPYYWAPFILIGSPN